MKKKALFIVFAGLFALTSIAVAQEIPYSHEDEGLTVLVDETIFFKSDVAMGKYWEPFTDIFGDGTIAIIAGAYPDGMTAGMNAKVAFINTDGSIEEYWAFYTDAGEPYMGEFNEARKDGNPPRIACDRRPGGTLYVTGEEATPFMYDEFLTDDRWDKDFIYGAKQIAAVQFFNKTADGPVPITNVIDPVYGSGTIAGEQSDQMRFGGEIRILSNGNILVIPEDRNKVIVPGGNGAVATIFDGETGEIVKEPFNSASDDGTHSIWSNVAAFDGGFAVRTEGIVSIYDNDGNLTFGPIEQAAWTTVTDTGRGDGTRIAGSIHGDFIYILGSDEASEMVVSSLNCKTGEPGREAIVSELELWDVGTFARGDLAVDSRGNICVAYVFDDEDADVKEQIVARILDSNMEPVTRTFFAFSTFDRYSDAEKIGVTSKEVNVSMDDNRIVIAADGNAVDPDTGALTPDEHAFAIVLESPFATSINSWELY